jgi:hypothetical protein
MTQKSKFYILSIENISRDITLWQSTQKEASTWFMMHAHHHGHYSVWCPQLIIIIMELLQLIGKIDIVVLYEGTESHYTDFAIICNGGEDTTADPGFNDFDFRYVKMATCNLMKGSRVNVAESYGYSALGFEPTPDKASGCYCPSLKNNTVANHDIMSLFISMSDSIQYIDKEGVFYNPLHPQVRRQFP